MNRSWNRPDPGRVLLTFAVGLALAACGEAPEPVTRLTDAGLGADASRPEDAAADAAVPQGVDASVDASSGPGDDCSDAAKLVYVLDEDGTLSSFAPDSLTFHEIGKVACDSAASPFSMSVDRNGDAWVVYDSGQLYKVSTRDARCSPLARAPGDQGFRTFGMGFVAPNGTQAADQLFIAGERPLDLSLDFSTYLGRIAPSDLATSRVGPLAGAAPELTGTGDGKLWAFYAQSSPPSLARLDLTSAASLESHPLPMLAGGARAWAFAFWGGEYWLFLAPSAGGTTTVWRVNGQSFAQTAVLPDTGRMIVGAGVSTCAPLVLR